METIQHLGPELGIAAMCAVLGVARATFYRRQRPAPMALVPARLPPPRKLPPEERKAVLNVLHEPCFADKAPAEVYATLLDEGTYLCSERTMYRVLDENQEVVRAQDIPDGFGLRTSLTGAKARNALAGAPSDESEDGVC